MPERPSLACGLGQAATKLADLRARHKVFIKGWMARHPGATWRQAKNAWKSHIGEANWKQKDTRRANARKLAVLKRDPAFVKYLANIT